MDELRELVSALNENFDSYEDGDNDCALNFFVSEIIDQINNQNNNNQNNNYNNNNQNNNNNIKIQLYYFQILLLQHLLHLHHLLFDFFDYLYYSLIVVSTHL